MSGSATVVASSPTASETAAPVRAAAATSREQVNARCAIARLLPLLLQLGILLATFHYFNIENAGFQRLAALTFGAFLIHYFLPFAWKKVGFVVLALAVGVGVLGAPASHTIGGMYGYATAAVFLAFTMALALVFYAVLRLPIPFGMRATVLVGMGCTLGYLRYQYKLFGPLHWQIFAAIFMFRMIVYAYEVKVARQPERLIDYLCYFFLPPNFLFVLFPVVDYLTFKRSWYADDIHRTAQRGIDWMARGAVQLCLYKLIYHRLMIGPEDVNSFGSLCHYIFPSYLLYLQVSGQFHIIVGLLHLFGYKLPETNRQYLLAESFTDFWRRINIYWKDFMVKVFYYPTYFRLRKRNEKLALAVATLVVFLATWALHIYQWFWLKGYIAITLNDTLFWTILGVLVLATVLLQSNIKKAPQRSPGAAFAIRVMKTLGVYIFISVLWSFWSAESASDWLETVLYWR